MAQRHKGGDTADKGNKTVRLTRNALSVACVVTGNGKLLQKTERTSQGENEYAYQFDAAGGPSL